MGPPCKIIKYKKKRSSKPIIKPKKLQSVPITAESSSKSDVTLPFSYGEVEGEAFQPLLFPPEKSTLERLREWVDHQRFIPHDLSDEFLTLFLSAVGYNVEEAAEKLEKYFFSRQEPSFLFRDRDPLSPSNVELFKTLYVVPMPDTTDDGRKIILTGLVNQTRTYNQMDHAKALAMVFDLLIWERDFGFGDFVIVMDGRGFECPQLLENKVYNHRSIKSLLLDTIPGTLRSFFLLYPPPHVTKVADTRHEIWITVVRSKMEMKSYLPADILPLEYGGNLGHLGDLLEQWELHMAQSRDFFIYFEKRMIKDYQRKLCFEKEVKEKGKNWVHQMKLEADEWEYKIKYYERMRNMVPLKHPAFGSQRSLHKPKSLISEDSFLEIRRKAREEAENAKLFEPTKLYGGYAKQIREAKLAEERQKLKERQEREQQLLQQLQQQVECCRIDSPVLELEIHYSE